MSEAVTPLNPFPGLRSFESNEDFLFFGREGQAEELLRCLRRFRFVAVVGPSGSGKSSLVKAGLLPALHGGLMSGPGKSWRVTLFRPGDQPTRELATALNRPGVLGQDGLEEGEAVIRGAFLEASLRRSSRGLVEAVARARLPSDENLLVVVDQFEELFRFRQTADRRSCPDESASFVKLLLTAAAAKRPSVYVIITMRSDFLGDCARFRDLPEAINKGQYLIPRMTRDQKRRAVEGPAGVCGTSFAPMLVQHLLNDVGDNPDQLPILQHVLMRIWDKRAGDGGEMPGLSDYEAVGKMETALSRHADEVYRGLPDTRSRGIAEKMFKAITAMGPDMRGMRSPVSLGELLALTDAGESEVVSVIEAFRGAGRSFLAPPAGVLLSEDSVVDISHESLMRIWDRLEKWVAEEAKAARGYVRLAESAVLFQRGEAGLLTDPALQLALDWRERNLPIQAWAMRYHPEFELSIAFLKKSKEARDEGIARREASERRELERARALAEEKEKRLLHQEVAAKRLKGMMAAITVFLMISIFYGVHAYRQLGVVEKARDAAEKARKISRSHELSAFAALELERDPALSFRLAEAALSEWPTRAAVKALLPPLEGSFNFILGGHGDTVCDAVFSPDGKTVATASMDQTARVWDAEEGKLLKALKGEGGGIRAISYSPNGKRILAASVDGSARIWDLGTGASVTLPAGHTEALNDAAFSPDGEFVVTASADGTARIWNARDGSKVRVLEKHSDEVTGVSFSPDGKLLVTASDDDTALIWDLENGRVRHRLGGHSECVKDAGFSPDGRFAVTASEDDTARIWDVGTGESVRVLTGHTDDVLSASFSPDGKQILTSSMDLTARIWDAASGISEPPLRGHRGGVLGAAFSPNGGKLVTASYDHTARVWHIGRPRVLKGHTGPVVGATFSPDGRRVISAGRDGTVRIWDAGRGRAQNTLTLSNADFDTRRSFSADGKRVVTPSEGNTASIWEVDRGERLFLLKGHGGQVTSAEVSPDGKYAVTGSMDGTARIWDVETGGTLHILSGHTWSVMSACFSSDGKRVLTTSMDDTVRIWNAGNGGQMQVFAAGGGLGSVTAACSPGGKLVLTTSLGDTGAGIWDSLTGKKLRELNNHSRSINSAGFSPDGRYVVTASMDGTALIWDAAGNRVRHVLRGHGGSVTRALFSPDSGYVATASEDHTVRIWDAENGEMLHELRGHGAEVTAVSFSPDGDRVVSTSMDGTVRIWVIDSGKILDDINIAGIRGKVRGFTKDELKRYGLIRMSE